MFAWLYALPWYFFIPLGTAVLVLVLLVFLLLYAETWL